jgi:hypothetical protein
VPPENTPHPDAREAYCLGSRSQPRAGGRGRQQSLVWGPCSPPSNADQKGGGYDSLAEGPLREQPHEAQPTETFSVRITGSQRFLNFAPRGARGDQGPENQIERHGWIARLDLGDA